jgi:signal transduction histidine kinase
MTTMTEQGQRDGTGRGPGQSAPAQPRQPSPPAHPAEPSQPAQPTQPSQSSASARPSASPRLSEAADQSHQSHQSYRSDPAVRTRLEDPTLSGVVVGRVVGLGIITLNLLTGDPGAGTHGRQLVVAVLGGTCWALWLAWTLTRWLGSARLRAWTKFALPVAFGLIGAVLTGLVPTTAGAVFPAAAALTLAIWAKPFVSAALTGVFALTALAAGAASGHSTANALAWSTLILGFYGIGQARRARVKQLEAVEELLVETERANTEEAHSAALAERSRIAREIHDVLAHSLAALTVQLEAADALLTEGRIEQAHGYVVKARRIAREGMVETRRAITALREDLPPLPALLESLVENYRADVGASAVATVLGKPRPLSAETALTVYRTAQESLTNVRKHAPGAPVQVTLAFEPEQTRLTVVNGPSRGGPSPLAGSGGGYGLAGLRERAELASGTLTAQPVDGVVVGGTVEDGAVLGGTVADGTVTEGTQGDGLASEAWAVTLTIPVVN